jgi:hypothetical protein
MGEIIVRLHDVHWDGLETQAVIGGWMAAKQMGLTVEQSDAIVLPAFQALRERVELWAGQQAKETPSGEQKQRALRHTLAEVDIVQHDAMVEQHISSAEALDKIEALITAYLDEWEHGAW